MEDESMIVIRFWNTPKGDLPDYSCISRNPESSRIYSNNAECSRLGDMLYLETKKGKEATNTTKFQQDTRGTAACIKIITRGKKGCGKL